MFVPGALFDLKRDTPNEEITQLARTAPTAAELKTEMDRQIAIVVALDPRARIVGFSLSAAGAGVGITCTLTFWHSPNTTVLSGIGIPAAQANLQIFEAGRGVEANIQISRLIQSLAADSTLFALDTAGGGAGAVFVTGALFGPAANTLILPGLATGTAVLVAGTVTVNVAEGVADGAKVIVQTETPGGTLGVTYQVNTIVPGVPGSFDIDSLQTTGAVQASDTSTVRWYLFNAPIIQP